MLEESNGTVRIGGLVIRGSCRLSYSGHVPGHSRSRELEAGAKVVEILGKLEAAAIQVSGPGEVYFSASTGKTIMTIHFRIYAIPGLL